MSTTLPNVPFQIPIADASGRITETWSKFFLFLYNRAGKAIALSNTELAALNSGAISTLQTQVSTLQATVTSLSSQVTSNASDIGQGRLP